MKVKITLDTFFEKIKNTKKLILLKLILKDELEVEGAKE